MDVNPTDAPSLACTIGAIPAEERATHRALLQHLFTAAVRERRPRDDGYAFRFRAEDFDAIARFVAHERKCCPFLSFELQITPDDGPAWLRLGDPPGTPAFLEAELPGAAASHVAAR